MLLVLLNFKKIFKRAWVAQSVKHPILDFGSSHDLMFSEIKLHIGSALTAWRLLGILSFHL